MVDYLQVREHAQQAPQQTAVYCLTVSLPLNEQQDPIDSFTLDFQVADDVEPEQFKAHVPAERSSLSSAQFSQCDTSNAIGAPHTAGLLTRLMAALNFVRHKCGPETRIYS